ncbi:hypothetical protein C5B96_08215 [Subtercola sp. Z020]|uniref:hypothetical protein n=1 Tax=Subtercola sp. Z020 TaxID=2080582 RepID=UPI000CE7AFDD|nr:hypothetical protein [Subtercola sp. Z020]PPF83344.1 hypothetical protein C5B96_08215 [Subtercola sp. Z020]
MAPLIIVSALAGWVVLALPVGLLVGRISHRADVGSEPRSAPAPRLGAPVLQTTGVVGSLTR